MLNDLDESIKQLLLRAGRLDPSQIDISFETPNREWSEKLGTRPTLNCYLFDLHERRVLREEGWGLEGRGTRASARRAPPLFFEITYLITAWTRVVEDEHFLLWRALEALMDHPTLDEPDLQGALRDHPWPIATNVAQQEGVLKSPGEFWTALENQLKPSLSYSVILGRERRPQPTDAPPVLTSGLHLRLPETTQGGVVRLAELFTLPAGATLAGVTVRARPFDERTGQPGAPVVAGTSDADGVVRLALAPGRYQLEADLGAGPLRRSLIVRRPEVGSVSPYSEVVRDQLGRPIGGVRVEAEGLGLRAITDEAGQFSLSLPPGRHTLRLHLDGRFERREVIVRSLSYPLRLELGGVPAEPGQTS